MTSYTVIDTPIGDLLLVAETDPEHGLHADPDAGPDGAPDVATDAGDDTSGATLSGAYLVGQRYEREIGADWIRDAAAFTDIEKQFDAYFDGSSTSFDVRFALHGSDFQRRVWQALADIPYGQTRTYGEVAARIADRSKTRAVASAIGHNPLGIVVPCHRVIGADGSLTGYAGGLERKRWLLDHEARVAGLTLAL